jgi:hypothetical protein
LELKGNNLGIYILRQRTQELLYEARKLSEKNKLTNPLNSFHFSNYAIPELNLEEDKDLKKKLKEFHSILHNYILQNHLENNPFLKTLCDDIYIAYKSAGTPYATMFTTARQTSQGRQQTYNCSTIDEIDTPAQFTNYPNLNVFCPTITTYAVDQDLCPHIGQNLDQDQDCSIDNYTLSQDVISPYYSDGVVTLMRGVSGNHSIGPQSVTSRKDEMDKKNELTLDFP